MNATISALFSVGVLAAIALIVTGGFALRRPADRKRGALMIAAGLVILGNVWLYATMPAG